MDFGHMQFWCPNERFVYICEEEKFKFTVNYDKWLLQSRNFHYEMDHTTVVHLDFFNLFPRIED